MASEGAAGDAHAAFDRRALEQILSGLGNRTFLLNNVHESAPQLFQTRWTLSYLRGPLTRDQIRVLMAAKRAPAAAPPQSAGDVPGKSHESTLSAAPALPPEIKQYFVPVRSTAPSVYQPVLVCGAKLHCVDDKRKIQEDRDLLFLAPLSNGVTPVNWDQAAPADIAIDELENEPAAGVQFEALPDAASKAKNYVLWTKAFANWLFQTQKLDLFQSAALGECSRPEESERDFRIRLQQKAREERDLLAESLRQKYAPKLAALEERKRRAEIAAGQQKSQQTQAMLQTAVTVGTGLLSAFLGRKAVTATTLSKAATAAPSGRPLLEGITGCKPGAGKCRAGGPAHRRPPKPAAGRAHSAASQNRSRHGAI